jgi:ribosomal protein S8
MKRIIVILVAGLLLSLPVLGKAQEINLSNQSHFSKKKNTIETKSKLTKIKETQPMGDIENLSNKEGFYQIIVVTKGQKKENIWVELEPGEKKYITIELDNGRKKSVSIRLEDEKKPNSIRLKSYNRLSQLMLQPISF